jgi:hypothetical protein
VSSKRGKLMSILSDAFLATDAELAATQFEGSGGPIAFFPTLQGKGIDPLKLLLLEAIVMDQAIPNPDILDQRIVRGKDESSEQWIYQFPDTMVARLAELTAAEISRYGTMWASTEEWRGPKEIPPIAVITHYFQQLCQLAMHAQTEERHIYMWIAL